MSALKITERQRENNDTMQSEMNTKKRTLCNEYDLHYFNVAAVRMRKHSLCACALHALTLPIIQFALQNKLYTQFAVK